MTYIMTDEQTSSSFLVSCRCDCEVFELQMKIIGWFCLEETIEDVLIEFDDTFSPRVERGYVFVRELCEISMKRL